MAYCTIDDVLKMVKEDMYESVIESDSFENEEEKVNAIKELIRTAIEDADSEIDGYLSKRYSLPFTTVPRVLFKFSKDIAIYNLLSRRGINEDDQEKTILTRYNAAVKFLENVAKGIIDIGEATNTTQAAAIGFRTKSNERIFSRDSMRGY